MTKNDLADKVAERNGLSASQARQALESVIETVSDELAAGGEVSLAGFGRFSVSHRSAREGRNPSTGATIKIAASKSAKFSAASALKNAEPLTMSLRAAGVQRSPAYREGPVTSGRSHGRQTDSAIVDPLPVGLAFHASAAARPTGAATATCP